MVIQNQTSNILNTLEVSKSKINKNFQLLKKIAGDKYISPVLKSNAYGHGIELVGPLFDKKEVPFICVNSFFEAKQLRNAGVKTEILIMGYVDEENLNEKMDFSFVIFSLEYARKINSIYESAKVHINIETGLHREGFDILSDKELLGEIKKLNNLKIEGVSTHLACSNDPECETTKFQLENFKNVKELLFQNGINPKWFHVGGALALLNDLADEFNVIRCGKALFGIALNTTYQSGLGHATPQHASIQEFELTFKLKTKIAQVKKVKKGEHVGYADAFIADKDMTIGILPIGYYDGLDRRLSNKGFMRVGDKECRILGIVAMNITVIDLSDTKNPQAGQEVIVYSDDYNDKNSIDNVAKICETLPQELVVRLPVSLTRKFMEENTTSQI